MEKNKDNIETILTEKEVSINNPNLYFYLSLINMTYYINFFPKLENENIQRIKYYFSFLYDEFRNINLSLIDLQTVDRDIIDFALSKLFFKKPDDRSFLIRCFICEIIVLESYVEIANLVSKKNIFTKPIEYKISRIISSIKKIFVNKISQIRQRKMLTFEDVYNLSRDSLKSRFYIYIKERQNIRFKNVNFQEYKTKIKYFQFFSDKNSVLYSYRMSKTGTSSEYEKYFFTDLPKILENIETINKNAKEKTKSKKTKK